MSSLRYRLAVMLLVAAATLLAGVAAAALARLESRYVNLDEYVRATETP